MIKYRLNNNINITFIFVCVYAWVGKQIWWLLSTVKIAPVSWLPVWIKFFFTWAMLWGSVKWGNRNILSWNTLSLWFQVCINCLNSRFEQQQQQNSIQCFASNEHKTFASKHLCVMWSNDVHSFALDENWNLVTYIMKCRSSTSIRTMKTFWTAKKQSSLSLPSSTTTSSSIFKNSITPHENSTLDLYDQPFHPRFVNKWKTFSSPCFQSLSTLNENIWYSWYKCCKFVML